MEMGVAAAEGGVGEDAAPGPAHLGDTALPLLRLDAEEDLGDEILRQIGERRAMAAIYGLLRVLGGGRWRLGLRRRRCRPMRD
nr:unnamed protein product [Digitaria exilis]